MSTYFLRLNIDSREQWEEVDEEMFNIGSRCLDGELERYSGDYLIRDISGQVTSVKSRI